jgi:hypothetical protein
LGFTPSASSLSPYFSNTGASQALTAWPKMIGSETFIIVAFMCSENSVPSCLGAFDLLGEEGVERLRGHVGGVDDGAGGIADPSFRTVSVPAAVVSTIFAVAALSSVADTSLERKSPPDMEATRVLLSGDQSPMRCGLVWA